MSSHSFWFKGEFTPPRLDIASNRVYQVRHSSNSLKLFAVNFLSNRLKFQCEIFTFMQLYYLRLVVKRYVIIFNLNAQKSLSRHAKIFIHSFIHSFICSESQVQIRQCVTQCEPDSKAQKRTSITSSYLIKIIKCRLTIKCR